MKNPAENQNQGTEQIPKTVIQGNISHREHRLKFRTEEADCIPGQISPET